MRLPIVLIICSLATSAAASDANDIFLLRTTDKAPNRVVDAIKNYSNEMEWLYVGDSKVKKGEVTIVKICIPEVGRAVWPAGLRLSALLPCGNIGVYEGETGTEISILHPRYMYMLYPDPATEKAGEIALPLLQEMLDAVVQ